ncbi:MAG: ferredoxin-type protein NapF [Endozoicomonas sp.]
MGQPIDSSRRFFFRSSKQQTLPARPPWSLSEETFIDRCERCDLCINACQTGLLIKGSGGFPEADFTRAACSFCEACISACPKQLMKKNGQKPWPLLPVIKSNCLAQNKIHCRTCAEMCDSDAISFRLALGNVAQPVIDHSACTVCAECVASCPVSAINMKPAEESANAENS